MGLNGNCLHFLKIIERFNTPSASTSSHNLSIKQSFMLQNISSKSCTMSSVWILKYEVLAFSLGDRKVHYDSFKHPRSDFLIFAY